MTYLFISITPYKSGADMILKDLIEGDLGLTVLTTKEPELATPIKGGYTSDLLSQVLAKARGKSVWITIQNHLNIVGVASMLDLNAVIICEGRKAAPDVIAKADEEGIILLSYDGSAYDITGKLYEKGL
jgi:hypothetical protein